MSTLAVIATLYGERGALAHPALVAAIAAQTRQPDEVWWMTEAILGIGIDLPTPRNADGRYAEVPYSRKINYALDRTQADYIVYLTDDSLPRPDKYARMAAALDEHPEWGAVYCGQRRNGIDSEANDVVYDAHCVLDHTQVMHRRTADRWPIEMGHVKLGDAEFWRALHRSIGPFYPVGADILDETTQTPDGISATY